jgi:mycothiol synthase
MTIPTGYTVRRPIPADANAVAAVMTCNRVYAPGASLDLWLAVWDGYEIAATMICDARRYEMGWIGSIGVRKPWRRRGLGLALLHHAFKEFWLRGERTVGLGVDAENPTGATRLYERAGMQLGFEFVVYEKRPPV